MKILKSRTIWVLIFAFITNGLIAIQGDIDPTVAVVLNAILMSIAAHFKLNPSQTY